MTGRGIVCVMGFALLLGAGLASGYREIFLAVFCLGLVLVISFLSVLWGALSLRGSQSLSQSAVVREESTRLQITLAGFLPLPVTARIRVLLADTVQLSGTLQERQASLESMTLLTPIKRDRTAAVDIACPHRGAWSIGVDRLRIQDIFGFFSLSLIKSHRCAPLPEPLTVYPSVAELDGAVCPPPVSADYAENAMVVADHGDSFSNTRQYRNGDSLKRIHWIQSIRTQQLYTRQYEISAENFNLILLDTGLPPAILPTGGADMMTECAASMALFYVLHGQPVCLRSADGDWDMTAYTLEDFYPLYTLLATVPFHRQHQPLDPGISSLAAGSVRTLHLLSYRPSRELLEALRPLAAHCRITCVVPPLAGLTALEQQALEAGIHLVPILCPEDITTKLGEYL